MPGTSDAARLFAYGGNAFVYRAKVGMWPAISEGVLQDIYGLYGGIAFGMGCLEDRRFLILRQRQNLQNRGGYAYTFLLDPGISIWRRFQWNAAALAVSILADAETSSAFLKDVESCTSARIEALLARLQPVQSGGAVDNTAISLLAGSLHRDGVLTTHGRISMRDMSASIEGLPVPLRGQTFLVGGCRLHAEVLGTGLTWDDEGGKVSLEVEEVVSAGSELISGWRSTNVKSTAAIEELPAFLWPRNLWLQRLQTAIATSTQDVRPSHHTVQHTLIPR
jgi:hypothetical protein